MVYCASQAGDEQLEVCSFYSNLARSVTNPEVVADSLITSLAQFSVDFQCSGGRPCLHHVADTRTRQRHAKLRLSDGESRSQGPGSPLPTMRIGVGVKLNRIRTTCIPSSSCGVHT